MQFFTMLSTILKCFNVHVLSIPCNLQRVVLSTFQVSRGSYFKFLIHLHFPRAHPQKYQSIASPICVLLELNGIEKAYTVSNSCKLFAGLSIVQNGKIPQFFSEDQLEEIFKGKSSSPAIVNLQKGLAKLGIYQVPLTAICMPQTLQDPCLLFLDRFRSMG